MGLSPTYFLALAFAGASAFLLAHFAVGLMRQSTRRVAFANARLKVLEDEGSAALALERMRRRRGLNEDGELRKLLGRLRRLILHSGMEIPLWGVVVLMPVLSICLGGALYLWREAVWASVLGAAMGPVLPVLFLRWRALRRRNKAVGQLPDALDVIIRSLAAGHPVPVAMGLVGREMPDPIGSEFGIASDEVGFGAGVSSAIQRMADRIDHADVYLFAAMIRLQERTGGNLAELLRANAKTIRDRQTMRLKVRAASAEGRMSALILNLAPLGVFIGLQALAPDFYAEVDGHPWVRGAIIFVVVWMCIGNLVIRRLINFRI